MLRKLALVLAVALAACSQAETAGEAVAPGPEAASAETAAAEAAPAGGGSAAAPAGAEATITTWARERYGTSLIEPVTIFYGDFTGDDAPDALAWADYATGGTSWDHRVALFRNQAGRMTFVRMVEEVYGMEPGNARFSAGRIMIDSKIEGPNDPRCCPTQLHTWTINTR